MMTTSEVKALRKKRIWGNLWQGLVGIPVAFAIFYWSPVFLRYFDKRATSFGIQVLQAFILPLVGVMIFASVSHIMALMNEGQFKNDAWKGESRYARLYRDYFWALVVMAAFALGSLPPQQ